MLPFKDIISVLFFVGILRTFAFSYKPDQLSKYGEKCQTAAVTGEGTCTRAELCPDMFQDSIKKLGTRSLTWGSEMIEQIYQGYFCGMRYDEDLFCCESPTELEDIEDAQRNQNLKILDLDTCGLVSKHKIEYGYGNRTYLFELPWMAMLIRIEGDTYTHICSGSVLHERYILTAAQCVDEIKPTHVRVGEHDLRTPVDCQEHLHDDIKFKMCAPPHQDIPVEKIIIHPKYRESPFYNDIALLKLSRPADLSSVDMRPICIPSEITAQTENLTGKMVEISGWGRTEQGLGQDLLKASVQVLEPIECDSFPPISSYSQICVGKPSRGTNTCLVDTGGPLAYYDDSVGHNAAYIYGVASRATQDCEEEDSHLVYTHVGFHMKFILDNLER